jgi:pyruvate dehydrogenase E2 component (dihydrolipoamide acetyltransferase)
MADFLMPALGADMETGKVVQWLVKPGDRVHKGDIVAVVETHKGAIDVEIFLDGVIDDLVPLDQALPVGAVLARVRTDEVAPSVEPLPLVPAPVSAQTRVLISPAARRRAGELGVDWHAIRGSGVDGAVTLKDLASAASASSPMADSAPVTAPARRGFDATQMRQAIAAAMGRSKREIPHYYLGTTIDFAAANSWLQAHNRDLPPEERLLPAVLLLKATALALREVPQLNGHFEQGVFKPGAGVHVGWAIALRGGGLIAPAIHGVDGLSLKQLMAALRDLVQRARSGGLRSSELTDPTVTVTSLGERGAESVYGVIYPPQVAIVGFGRVSERPWVVEGRVVARPLVNASLAADHRVSDGHLGGQLLTALDRALQLPEHL